MQKSRFNYTNHANSSALLLVTRLRRGPIFTQILELRRQMGLDEKRTPKLLFRLEVRLGGRRLYNKRKRSEMLAGVLERVSQVKIYAENRRKELRPADREDFAAFVTLDPQRTELRRLADLGLFSLIEFLKDLENSPATQQALQLAGVSQNFSTAPDASPRKARLAA